MKQTGYTEHQGIVTKVNENSLSVNLINVSSCSGCHVKGFCNVSDTDHKSVEISTSDRKIGMGDKVIVHYEKRLGPLALLLGYISPFFLVLAVLIISLEISGNEGLSGLLSLAVLIPYYLGLYFIRDLLKSRFAFTVKPLKHQSI